MHMYTMYILSALHKVSNKGCGQEVNTEQGEVKRCTSVETTARICESTEKLTLYVPL